MKKRNLIALLFLLVAGVQTVWSQAGMLVWQNGSYQVYHVNKVDSVQFVSDASQYTPAGEFVDLALPSGTLWANLNVGASSPEDFGGYFAWGETVSKENFSWESYQLANGSETSLNSYCTDISYGSVDDKIVLHSANDAATAIWGDDWEMPSMAQFEELLNGEYTTVQKTFQNDVYGMLIKSKANGKSIFLPAAGMRIDTDLYNDGTRAYYWSRQLYTDTNNPTFANNFNFDTRFTSLNDKQSRCYGLSIRPVRKQTHEYVDLGLPSGTLWATTNIGAQNPADSGDFFAWGETRPKSNYSWETYKWMKPGQADWTQINKYTWSDGKTEGCWYVGETCQADYKDKLDPADDAATVNWGDEWQMPTNMQMIELASETTAEWAQMTDRHGILCVGIKFTSGTNGNSIFLPVTGYYDGVAIDENSVACWTRSLSYYDSSCAFNGWYADFNRMEVAPKFLQLSSGTYRYLGYPIRPVRVR